MKALGKAQIILRQVSVFAQVVLVQLHPTLAQSDAYLSGELCAHLIGIPKPAHQFFIHIRHRAVSSLRSGRALDFTIPKTYFILAAVQQALYYLAARANPA